MKRLIGWILCGTLVWSVLPVQAFAGVNVERQSAENPMVEIFRSTLYGALTGAVVGGVIMLAAQTDADTNRDILRWSVVGGTALGLGVGMYFTAKRPQPSGLLEFDDGGAFTRRYRSSMQAAG